MLYLSDERKKSLKLCREGNFLSQGLLERQDPSKWVEEYSAIRLPRLLSSLILLSSCICEMSRLIYQINKIGENGLLIKNTFPSEWLSAPTNLSLKSDEVHVWRAFLDPFANLVAILADTLTDDELKRAERLYFQEDRSYFVLGRGVLRTLLGRYLKCDPKTIRFCYGPYGKPSLTPQANGSKLRFNISHSHRVALYAFTYDREIGVDVECIRNDELAKNIPERFFSPREASALESLPEHEQNKAFFTYWTCKEAYLKARGVGLFSDLQRVEVSVTSGAPVLLTGIDGDQKTGFWSLSELNASPGCAAALAVNGHGWSLKCLQWENAVQVFPVHSRNNSSIFI
jgi:4'-phosphopantetheinyl transferase